MTTVIGLHGRDDADIRSAMCFGEGARVYQRFAADLAPYRVEESAPAEVQVGALARDEDVFAAERRDPYFGGVSAIGADGGGADPRRSGVVIPAIG